MPHEATRDPLIGALLAGSYRVKKSIARGGMGSVYLGVHERLGVPVAIKVLAPEYLARKAAITRFRREAHALARLRNDHVIRVIDTVDHVDGSTLRPCLVTEFLTGESLQERLDRESRLPPFEALGIAADIAQALVAAHAAGVIHRDLKPSNIYLTTEGRAVLLDFGVAHLHKDPGVTQEGALVGTPPYMPPEQVRGEKASARTDIYGLGAVIYRMLSGKPPYQGKATTQVLSKVLDGPPAPPSQHNPAIPYDIELLVLQLMARDTRLRPKTASDVLTDIRTLCRRHLPGQNSDLRRQNLLSSVVGTTAGLSCASLAPNLPTGILVGLLGFAITFVVTRRWSQAGVAIGLMQLLYFAGLGTEVAFGMTHPLLALTPVMFVFLVYFLRGKTQTIFTLE